MLKEDEEELVRCRSGPRPGPFRKVITCGKEKTASNWGIKDIRYKSAFRTWWLSLCNKDINSGLSEQPGDSNGRLSEKASTVTIIAAITPVNVFHKHIISVTERYDEYPRLYSFTGERAEGRSRVRGSRLGGGPHLMLHMYSITLYFKLKKSRLH